MGPYKLALVPAHQFSSPNSSPPPPPPGFSTCQPLPRVHPQRFPAQGSRNLPVSFILAAISMMVLIFSSSGAWITITVLPATQITQPSFPRRFRLSPRKYEEKTALCAEEEKGLRVARLAPASWRKAGSERGLTALPRGSFSGPFENV